MFADPNILQRPFTYTVFRSKTQTEPIERQGTIQSFIEEVFDPNRLRESKDKCPLLQCARYKPGTTRGNDGIESFTALVGDYDEAEVPMKEAADLLRAIGIFSIFYQSFSSTTRGEKWRVIVPTTSEMDASTLKLSLARLNRILSGVGAGLSPESFVPAQAYYYGFNKELAEQGDIAEFSEAVPGALLDVGSTFFMSTPPLFPVFTRAEMTLGRPLFPNEAEAVIQEETRIKGGKLGTGTNRTGHLFQYLKSYRRQNQVGIDELTAEAMRIADTYFLDHHTMRISAIVNWIDSRIEFEPRTPKAEVPKKFLEPDDPEDIEYSAKVQETKLAESIKSGWEADKIDLRSGPRYVEFVLDNFIPAGPVMIAAPWGAGKTTNLFPIALVSAGLVSFDDLKATIRRKVIWFSEDPSQVVRILESLRRSEAWAQVPDLENWIVVVQSKRREPPEVRKVLRDIKERYSYLDDRGFSVRPLVVFDTATSNFNIENENDNSMVAGFVAAIRSANLPVWIIGHTAKALIRGDVSDMNFRGAGAWEAEAVATLFLFHDEAIDRRVLALRKRRFSGETYTEIHFSVERHSEGLEVPWSDQPQMIEYIHGVPEAGSAEGRKEARAEVVAGRREEAKEARRLGRISEILDFVTRSAAAGRLVTRNTVVEGLGNRKYGLEIIRGLIDAEQIQSVEIPEDLRPLRAPVGTKCLIPIDLVAESYFSRVRELESSGRVQ